MSGEVADLAAPRQRADCFQLITNPDVATRATPMYQNRAVAASGVADCIVNSCSRSRRHGIAEG